jgi:hypothetical protein
MMPLSRCGRRRATTLAIVGILALGLAGCDPTPTPATSASATSPAEAPAASAEAQPEVHDFTGFWNGTGTRKTIPLGQGKSDSKRTGSIIDLHGTMLLAGRGKPGVGFRADVIALVDSATGLSGRAVWTDEHGDQVFSELNGEGDKSSNHIAGTILGGSGRYANASGAYEFSWSFVIDADDGSIQGEAVGLKGSMRFPEANVGVQRP